MKEIKVIAQLPIGKTKKDLEEKEVEFVTVEEALEEILQSIREMKSKLD